MQITKIDILNELKLKHGLEGLEGQFIKDEILRLPDEELNNFARELLYDVDDIIKYRLDLKTISYYAKKAITRAYSKLASKIGEDILRLKNNKIEYKPLYIDGVEIYSKEEVKDFIDNGFSIDEIIERIHIRVSRYKLAKLKNETSK